jgi:hypothetical protein
MQAPRDVGSRLAARFAGAGRAVAAGAGDAAKVTGATIDRLQLTSAKFVGAFQATLTAAATLAAAVEYQESADGSNWDAAVPLQASTVIATGAGGGSTENALVTFDMNLVPRKRYIRFNVTPDLSAGAADICTWAASLVGTGYLAPIS